MSIDLTDGATLLMDLVITVAAILSALAVIWRMVVKPLRLLADRHGEFLDDWQGVPARPGVPERVGVMAHLALHDDVLAEIRGQVYPNGGSSMRDSMDRVEVTLNRHLADPEAHHRMHGAA